MSDNPYAILLVMLLVLGGLTAVMIYLNPGEDE